MYRTTALEGLARSFEQNASKRLLIVAPSLSEPTENAAQVGHEVSYRDFWRTAEGMARWLAERGITPGARLLVQLENSEHTLALYLACAIGGYVACPIDPTLPKPQIAKIVAAIKPALHITDAELPSQREAARLSKGGHGTGTFGTGESDEDYLIIFSSGSTGEPKGIVHSLRSISESAASYAELSGTNADSVVYHHFPMFYMAGIFNMFFCPVMAGATIVVGPRFSRPQMLRFWQLPIKHHVNSLTLTPTMAHSLCQLYRRDERILEHLCGYQSLVATGSPLYSSIAERFYNTFHVPLRTCYGVTEVGGTITFQSWEDALAYQSMGGWAKNTEIRAGVEGAPKEVLIKTPFMARGYLIKGEIVKPYDAEGFFHAGDLGYLKDGLLYFSGREHDLVKKGGEFVSTQLIEDLALRNRLVTDVAAVGVPDEFWGARVVLFYVPQRDASEPEILPEFEKLFTEGLREIERPDKIIPVPWMPKTSIGKIVKYDLLSKYSLGPRMRP